MFSLPHGLYRGSTSAFGVGEKPPVEPPIWYMPQLPPPRYSALLALGSVVQLLLDGSYSAAWLVTSRLLSVTPAAIWSMLPDPLYTMAQSSNGMVAPADQELVDGFHTLVVLSESFVVGSFPPAHAISLSTPAHALNPTVPG